MNIRKGVVKLNGETRLKNQMSFYGDFSHIAPTEANAKKCIESFFGFGLLPSNIQVFDASNNKLEMRLSLQSMRSGLAVNFLANRIDFVSAPLPGSPAASMSEEEFLDEVLTVLTVAIETFDLSFGRVGFVFDKILKPLSHESLLLMRKRFFVQEAEIFPGCDSAEWTMRTVVGQPFDLIPHNQINVVYNISRVSVELGGFAGQKVFPTILISVDVNYPSVGVLQPISLVELKAFISQAVGVEKVIFDSVAKVAYEQE